MLELINDKNCHYYDDLVQDYEHEFAPLTGKKRDISGKYSIDANWCEPNIGYYWKEESTIKGFCIIQVMNIFSEVVEFYVAPDYRRNKTGEKMAIAVFNRHPGTWHVKQLTNAYHATKFWRKVINGYTEGEYAETNIVDPYWGPVVCQKFHRL